MQSDGPFPPGCYYGILASNAVGDPTPAGRNIRGLGNVPAVMVDLRVNNVLNDQGPIYSVSTALRPKGGDLTSPARETVANVYAYKQPVSVNLTATLRF